MLGNNTDGGGNKTFINLKLTATPGETTEKPMFVKLGEDFAPTGEEYSSVEGKLTKIKATHTPAKGRMGDVYGFKAFLEDGEEIYVIESTITNASKDLLNALLVNLGTKLSISLYLNKNGYPTSSVKLEDGNWAQTAFEFNAIDMPGLYDKIVELEPKEEETIEAIDVPF